MEKSLLLEAYLKQLRPPAVGRHYQEVARQAVQGNFSYEVFLLALMELEAQQREENALQKRLRLARFPVVKTLDQFDFTALPTLNKAQLFFQVVAQSYERQSLIITTNLEFSQWPQVFGSEQLTGALLDRLAHHAHILAMNGESFRFRESLKNVKSE